MVKKKKKSMEPVGSMDREFIEEDILRLAEDPNFSIRETAAYYGLSCRAVCRIIAASGADSKAQGVLPGFPEYPEEFKEEPEEEQDSFNLD
jgi:hypothetical protein